MVLSFTQFFRTKVLEFGTNCVYIDRRSNIKTEPILKKKDMIQKYFHIKSMLRIGQVSVMSSRFSFLKKEPIDE